MDQIAVESIDWSAECAFYWLTDLSRYRSCDRQFILCLRVLFFSLKALIVQRTGFSVSPGVFSRVISHGPVLFAVTFGALFCIPLDRSCLIVRQIDFTHSNTSFLVTGSAFSGNIGNNENYASTFLCGINNEERWLLVETKRFIVPAAS